MKRTIMLCLTLFICLALVACTTNYSEITQSDSGSLIWCEEGYQYGNMQKNIPPGNFMRLDKEVLFDYCSNGAFEVYSYNITTGRVQSYCKDATCNHSTCGASKQRGNLEVYKGKIYSLTKSGQVAEITETEKVIINSAVVSNFFHHDDKLYIKTVDSSLVVLEEGSNEPKVILEEYTGYWHMIFGQYLYANTNDDTIIRVDMTAEEPREEVVVENAVGITDGQHIYYVDRKTYYLYQCDMDGSNIQLLLESQVFVASMNFDDDYFYYRLRTQPLDEGDDAYDIYRFPKGDPTQIVKIATLPVPAYQVFTVPGSGIIFVKSSMQSNGEDNDIYVMGTDGSNLKRLEIPE